MDIAFLPKYLVRSNVVFTPVTLFLQHIKTGKLKVFDQTDTWRTEYKNKNPTTIITSPLFNAKEEESLYLE